MAEKKYYIKNGKTHYISGALVGQLGVMAAQSGTAAVQSETEKRRSAASVHNNKAEDSINTGISAGLSIIPGFGTALAAAYSGINAIVGSQKEEECITNARGGIECVDTSSKLVNAADNMFNAGKNILGGVDVVKDIFKGDFKSALSGATSMATLGLFDKDTSEADIGLLKEADQERRRRLGAGNSNVLAQKSLALGEYAQKNPFGYAKKGGKTDYLKKRYV